MYILGLLSSRIKDAQFGVDSYLEFLQGTLSLLYILCIYHLSTGRIIEAQLGVDGHL